MNVNDVTLGYGSPMADAKSVREGKLAVSEEWRNKITALGAKHGEETAQWVKNRKNARFAETLGKRHTQEESALYRDFVVSNGGSMTGMAKKHNLVDIQSRIADGGEKLGNKYTAAWREAYFPAFRTALGKHGVESAPVEEGGFKISGQGTLDILL